MAQSKPSPTTVSEVEFGLQDPRYPFVGVSQEESCRFYLADMFPRPDGRYAEYFQVRGVEPARVTAYVSTTDTVDVTVLTEYGDSGCLEFLVSGDCPAFRLTELGALPREVRGIEGDGCIKAEIPTEENPSEVINVFLDEYPDAWLRAKREKNGIAPRFSDSGVQEVLHNHLTDRQREILEKALEEGYYDWPRECTGEDIAAELNITSATFSEHIRAAEQKLFTMLFNGPESSQL
ncbi:bacterio-opsin activator domain-containing protein [Haloarcula sp. JP-L23]|uniref:helix-turn-helix domain-containing protein n=1 Tax=Haloarcula sp. JP-L23 TaxID=2716717 RepID=UPI00140F2244|nr:helix-turn-helix domain-containing protein [Haloarcula sp. JP-L23]